MASRRLRFPADNVGKNYRFGDGSSARVYRETAVLGVEPRQPCTLVVGLRLRLLRGPAHTVFQWESLLNTPLFAGFPGFLSKLWFAHDEHERYRGIYDWDDAVLAEQYARSLWRLLALGSVPGSISYRVVPGMSREELLNSGEQSVQDGIGEWWRPAGRG